MERNFLYFFETRHDHGHDPKRKGPSRATRTQNRETRTLNRENRRQVPSETDDTRQRLGCRETGQGPPRRRAAAARKSRVVLENKIEGQEAEI